MDPQLLSGDSLVLVAFLQRLFHHLFGQPFAFASRFLSDLVFFIQEILRQVLQCESGGGRLHTGVLDRIFQLTDIAGPSMVHQFSQCRGRATLDLLGLFFVPQVEEMVDQGWNVFDPVTQGGSWTGMTFRR